MFSENVGGGWIRTSGSYTESELQSDAIGHYATPPVDTGIKLLAVGIEPTTVRLQVGCSTN